MFLEIDHLTHTYQPGSPLQSTAVHDVCLSIREGETLALIGHTGSGKSTLAQHLNGLLQPTSGRVLLEGEDINRKGADKRYVRRTVGLLFQYPEHQLFEETVEKDVAFGPKNLGLSEEEIKERVREALARVELPYDETRGKSPFELSGGQMRRVALAGVLAMRPRALVLDEPAAGLDPRGREELMRLILSLRDTGVTLLLISHSMDDVSRVAERIAVLQDGKLQMLGAPAEIFARAQELEEMGLDVPQARRLSLKLQTMGLPIPDFYREEDIISFLVPYLKGGETHA